ncbi:photosystem reaction center subunit H [Hyphomicrobium nitrativorans NL23]|uniref:Photosystem reaction center subunit H n=1 Tax=Hyphomicrobium nitrativorans NL23 TaxID=1029756 RepID=V5SCL8_9HYPH|nr:PRC-barrel domain-containing protein [Hyphomicrobium nitrativorans]AHB48641.1 photosystem reaction center subunit H [Hyphomicrobium nitrativorans NL23]
MKHVSLLAAGLLAVAPLASLVAFAQEPTTFLAAQTENEYLARDHLIGAKVHGSEGLILGELEDLIVNDENQIVGVVLGTGGYFGFAQKKVGVALASLKFEEKDGALTVSLPDVTKETLAAAPDFQRRKPAKSLLDRAKEKAVELGDKTRAATKDAIERAQPTIDHAKQKTQEAYEKAKEAVSEAYDGAKDTVNEATAPEPTPAPTPAPATQPPAAPEPPAAPAAPEPPAAPAAPGQPATTP